VEIADDEPGDVVEDVVQAGDDQQPVENAVDEQADVARFDDPAAELVDPRFEPGKAEPEQDRADQPSPAGDDRHEPPAAEEGEIFGQLDVAEAVVKHARGDARKDAGRDAELVELLNFPGGNREVPRGGIGKPARGVGRDDHQHLGAFGQDEEADGAGKSRRAVILAREADRDADCEQQSEVREDRIAGSGDKRDVEQVGLAEPEQQTGDRKHRDRQHQRPAERLQALHAKLDHHCSP